MSGSYMKEFIDGFLPDSFPQELANRFDILNCLAESEFCHTFLLKEKSTPELYVLKRYAANAPLGFSGEPEAMKALKHKGLPEYICDYKDDNFFYVIREYIDGVTLREYVEQGRMNEQTALSVASSLCEIAEYLHSQTSPIIHRDIKPSNIVIDPHNPANVSLIDLGIARTYSDGAAHDTAYFGTKSFAPPEQFGYSQTDARTDIYSIGATLAYMLTEKADIREALPLIRNAAIRRIIRRATEFAPSGRFRSAAALRRKIQQLNLHLTKRIIFCVAGIIIFAGSFLGGAFLGRYTDVRLPFENLAAETPRFKSAVIEKAVRSALGKMNSEPITEDELFSVHEINIVGNEEIASTDQYERVLEDYILQRVPIRRAEIENLSDLSLLPELNRLRISYTDLTNLAGIEGCANLTNLELRYSPVTDISALDGLPALSDLTLDLQSLMDISPLAKIRTLNRLALVNLPLRDLNGLSACENLTTLNLLLKQLDDYSELYSIPSLKVVTVSNEMEATELLSDELTFELIYTK